MLIDGQELPDLVFDPKYLRVRVSEEGIEAAARALYYVTHHPGSVPGWTQDDADRYQPFMGTEPASESTKNMFRQDAKRVLRAAGAY